MTNIDPKLKEKMNSNEDQEPLKVFVHVSKSLDNNSNNTADNILNQTANLSKEKPTYVKILPKLNVMIIEGNTKYIRSLLENSDISSATISEE